MFVELNIVGMEYKRYSSDEINLAINGEDGESIEHITPALFNVDKIKAILKNEFDAEMTLIDLGDTKYVVKNTYEEVKALMRIAKMETIQ